MLYMRERMYATVYAIRSFNFPKFVRMYQTCMHHDKSFITYLHCSSPYKFLIQLSNSFLLYRCSHESCTIFCWYRWQHQQGAKLPRDVWYPYPALEGPVLRGVYQTAPLFLEWRIPRGTAMVWGAANNTCSYPSTLLEGVEGGFWRENSLGGCPSSGFGGAKSDMSAAQGWADR